jgi:hypothetical protein
MTIPNSVWLNNTDKIFKKGFSWAKNNQDSRI